MSKGINKHEIIGNLGADPKIRYSDKGKPVTTFSVATTDVWTTNEGEKREHTDWHNVVVFDKMAEHCNKHLKEGSQVRIEGPNRTSKYEKDGVTHFRSEVHARDVLFLAKPSKR